MVPRLLYFISNVSNIRTYILSLKTYLRATTTFLWLSLLGNSGYATGQTTFTLILSSKVLTGLQIELVLDVDGGGSCGQPGHRIRPLFGGRRPQPVTVTSVRRGPSDRGHQGHCGHGGQRGYRTGDQWPSGGRPVAGRRLRARGRVHARRELGGSGRRRRFGGFYGRRLLGGGVLRNGRGMRQRRRRRRIRTADHGGDRTRGARAS